jgi:hypothetical protein
MNWVKENRQLLGKSNCVLKANGGSKYWFGLSKYKIDSYLIFFLHDFNIIFIGADTNTGDYYSIPYNYIEDLLLMKTLPNTKDRLRWYRKEIIIISIFDRKS